MIRRVGDMIQPFREADGPPPRTLVAFFMWAISGSVPVLVLVAVISAVAGSFEVMSAFLLGFVIDSAIESGPDAYFRENWLLLFGAVLFFLVARPLTFGASSLANSVIVTPNIGAQVLMRLHRWTLGQAVTFFDNDFAGRIAQKQMQTSRAVADVVGEITNVLFFALSSIIGSALLLTSINGWLALGLFGWLFVYLGLLWLYMPRIRARSKARAAARATVTGQVVDTITNIKTVKLFAHQDHEEGAAHGTISALRDRSIEQGLLGAEFRTWLMVVAGLVPTLLIGGSLYIWSIGGATPGDVVAAGAIAIRIAQMTGWVSHVLMAIYGNVGEVEDGINTLTPAYTLTDHPSAVAMVSAEPSIAFEGVSFAYGRESGGVESIDLAIAPGEKLALVGASGAGKSTLVSLLLRLYDVEAGAVRIAGQDVRDVTQETLRKEIAMVTQETAMFNRTARENILYGRPDASEADIIAATKRAEAHDFILGLKDFKGRVGYDAYLGERGVKLSGGQRQRIALARAILKDAPILVLDEATSALDSEVEASIQSALEQVMEGKTVLAIAHRLSTIARMDRIVVLDEGRIAEVGTHDELLAKGGLYARFWERQSGGFLGAQEAAE